MSTEADSSNPELKEFFYQLKTIENDSLRSKLWHCDIILAKDKKSARQQVENDFDIITAEKITAKTKLTGEKAPECRIFIVELTHEWRKHWTTVHSCEICSNQFTFLMAAQAGTYCNSSVCSEECRRFQRKDTMEEYRAQFGTSPPCIYRISSKETGKCYIGQTTQPVTLRWYQHMFHLTGTKFHKEVQNSRIENWYFEVLEIVPDVKRLDEREQYWIDEFDSIHNGYNTAIAKKTA